MLRLSLLLALARRTAVSALHKARRPNVPRCPTVSVIPKDVGQNLPPRWPWHSARSLVLSCVYPESGLTPYSFKSRLFINVRTPDLAHIFGRCLRCHPRLVPIRQPAHHRLSGRAPLLRDRSSSSTTASCATTSANKEPRHSCRAANEMRKG